MTYEDCLNATVWDWESWTIVFVFAALALGLSKVGFCRLALAVLLVGSGLAVGWAYIYYELNCVELIAQ